MLFSELSEIENYLFRAQIKTYTASWTNIDNTDQKGYKTISSPWFSRSQVTEYNRVMFYYNM